MVPDWQTGLVAFLRTLSQILTAGVSITAFSLLLYALTFNLRDRVARTYALILGCVVITFTGEAIGSAAGSVEEINFWLHLQWVGIILLPATYLHFSDAVLAITGKPSRGRRYWAVRLNYVISLFFLICLPSSRFIGPVVMNAQPAPHLEPTALTDLFISYYLIVMVVCWFNFARAYKRTKTPTGQRRMGYLITGALAPAVGSFPFLLFGSALAGQHPLIFWIVSVLANFLVNGLIVVMAYAAAFFGVAWPDRVVKNRLFKWIMRGPVTASFTLAFVTLVRRTGEVLGLPYTALVPIVMVGTVLLFEYLITLFAPLGERLLFYGNDRADLKVLRDLENRLLTRNDLRQFLEMILAAICDRLQATGAYVVGLNPEGIELVVRIGKTSFDSSSNSDDLSRLVEQNHMTDLFQWGNEVLVPLLDGEGYEKRELLGLLGFSGVKRDELDSEQLQAVTLMAERAKLAMQDRRTQQQIFQAVETLTPKVDMIQRMRAVGRYEIDALFKGDIPDVSDDMVQWVREALTHYWGGPKLTESPLRQLKVVQDALNKHDGNYSNALRAILREGISRVRPEGERRFTAEWILYNILEMKFLEGRKVREIAMRLAMSEADLYRKQRIAIEAVAREIMEMENLARQEITEGD